MKNHLIHSQITYNRSIWQKTDWIVTRSRKLLFGGFVPEKREESNNTMKNQWRDLLGLWVWWLFPNRHWRDLSLSTDCRSHGVFGPFLSGWYERDLTLLFVGGADWGPLGGDFWGGRDLNMMFVGGSNRGILVGAIRGSTSPTPWFPNPSSLDFWIGFFYSFYITKILVIFVRRGRDNEFQFAVLCIAITHVVIHVPSLIGCCRRSLSGPLQRGGLQKSGCTASVSASQYFNIIIQGALVSADFFLPIGHHPRPCVWRFHLPLFRFDPFSLSL